MALDGNCTSWTWVKWAESDFRGWLVTSSVELHRGTGRRGGNSDESARSNWDEYPQDKGGSICTLFKACQDPALLAKATLDGDSELVNTLLAGAPDPFMSELRDLVDIQKASNYKPGWVLNQLFKAHPEATLTRDQWTLLGRELEYKPGWAYQKWQEFGGASQGATPES